MPGSDSANEVIGDPWQDDLALLRDTITEAGRIAAGYFETGAESWTKDGDAPVTEADMAVDRFLQQTLLDARPHYGWLSEESVRKSSGSTTETVFIVDPIDGTRGFIDRSDEWTISVAIVSDGVPVVGTVFNPLRDELYEATANAPACMNGHPISTSVIDDLGSAKLAASKRVVRKLAEQNRGPTGRYVPSLAYRLVGVADGTYDATISTGHAHEWDIAAAELIVARAGGKVSDIDGMSNRFNKSEPKVPPLVVAGLPLHGIVCERLRYDLKTS